MFRVLILASMAAATLSTETASLGYAGQCRPDMDPPTDNINNVYCSCAACDNLLGANMAEGCCSLRPDSMSLSGIPQFGSCVFVGNTETITTFLNNPSVCDFNGGGVGDPHIKKWDGTSYDYHGECDLVLLSSSEFGGSMGLDVHIRTTIVDDWSYISSAAVKLGPDTLEVTKKGKYTINGEADVALPATFNGYEVTYEKPTNQKKHKWHIFTVDLGNGQSITIKSFQAKDMLAVKVSGGSIEDFEHSSGLMGSFGIGDLVTRDGKTTLTVEDANLFGQEWQVNDQDPQLFKDKRAPQWPQQCILPSAKDAPVTESRRLGEAITRERAEFACAAWGEDIENCVQDVMATGDLELAEAGSY